MIDKPELSCLNCRWIDKETYLSCKAFPEGIPPNISAGYEPHITVVGGQVGDYTWRIQEDLLNNPAQPEQETPPE